MKRSLSFVVLLFFTINTFAPGIQVYADNKTQLQQAITSGVSLVEKIGDAANAKLETIDNTTTNGDQKDRINQKQDEITEYVQEVKTSLKDDTNSQKDVQDTILEAKKTIVLKVISGVTKYDDLRASIPQDIVKTQAKKQDAAQVLEDALKTQNDYSLIVKTKFTKEKIVSLITPFDPTAKVDFLYDMNDENYFEISVAQHSILGREMLGDIENGNVPENLFGIELVKPEVLSVNNFNGEDITSPWGIGKYHTSDYVNTLTPTLSGVQRIKVGVIDTGIDYHHTDLATNVSTTLGYDFVNDDSDAMDDQGHGTHVAGTIGAAYNHQGIMGVNPYAELVPLKICDANGFCPNYAIIRALEYAKEHQIPVVNMSLGGYGNPQTNPICDAIHAATGSGVIVVSAAGNSNTDTSNFVPGGCSDAISVGAVDATLARAGFSNYGNKVDVSAPGVSVYSTYIGGGYKRMSGTSMAAPHITGLISAMLTGHPNLTTSDIKNIFKTSGEIVNTPIEKKMGKFADADIVLQNLMSTSMQTQTGVILPLANTGAVLSSQDISVLDSTIQPLAPETNSGTTNTGSSTIQQEIPVINLNPNGEVHTSSDEASSWRPLTLTQENGDHPETLLLNALGTSSGNTIASALDDANIVYTPIDPSFTGSISLKNAGTDVQSETSESTGVTIPPELLSQLVAIPEVVETIPQGTSIQSTTTNIVMLQNDYTAIVYPAGVIVSVSMANMVTMTAGGGYVSLHSSGTLGTFQIYFRDQTGVLVSTVNVTIKLPDYSKEIQMGQAPLTQFVGTQGIYDNYNNSFTYSTPGIVTKQVINSLVAFTPTAPGTTTVTYYSGGVPQYNLIITVMPIPTAITCTIMEGQKCDVPFTSHRPVWITNSNSQIFTYGTYTSGSNIGYYMLGTMEGSARLTVSDGYADIAYIYVNVTLKPIPTTASCLIQRSGWRCDVQINNVFRYTYRVDNPNIISVIAKDNYFVVYGADPGTTTMYIKKNGVTVSTITYKVWPLSTVSVKYEFTTSATANYLNVSPVLYGQNGLGTLNMKATLLGINLYKKGGTVNLLKNGSFSSVGTVTGGGSWIGGTSNNGWYAYVANSAHADLASDRLIMEVKGNNSFIEVRNTSVGYWGVSTNSTPITPNTTYVMEYSYFLNYVSGDARDGFSVKALTQASNGVGAGEFQAQPYIKNPNSAPVRYNDLTLSTSALVLNVGQTGYFNITGGNNGYGVSKNNTNVGVYTNSTNGLQYKVTGNSLGTSIIQVTDSVGKVAQVTVYVGVTPPPTGSTGTGTIVAPPTTTSGTNVNGTFEYLDYDYYSDLGIAAINFSVDGTTTGGGVEFNGTTGLTTIVPMEAQTDGKYFLVFEKGNYTNFVPFYTTSAGVKVYYKNKTFLSYADQTTILQNIQDGTGVDISSVQNASRCQLQGSSTYWARPYYATCADNVSGVAWSCNSNYKDLNASGDGINSCIPLTYYNGQFQKDKNKIISIIGKFRTSAAGKDISIVPALLNHIASLQQKLDGNQKLSADKKSYFNTIFDDFRNELDKKTNPKDRAYQDVLSWFDAFQISANGGFFLDGYIANYTGKSRVDIDTYAQRFSEELFNYEYVYDPDFKTGFDAKVSENVLREQGISGITLTQAQIDKISQGVKDGVILGTHDYLMQYYDLGVGILNLHFPDVIGGVKNTWSFVASTVANLGASYDSFKQTLFNIYDKVSNLVSYDYSKGASYVGTSNALASTDPAGRVIGLFGGSVVIKIEKVIDDLVTSRARKILLAIQFDDIQLQAKFAHAVDFGIAGNYNLANRDLFKQAIINHSKDPATKLILGTYRTTIRVNHFFNELTGNNVMYDLDGNFISLWRLDAEQINYLKTTKNIQ